MTDPADQHVTSDKVDALIEKSSFGTPGARQLRKRTSPAVAEAIVERVAAADAPLAEPASVGHNPEELQTLLVDARRGDPDTLQRLLHHLLPLLIRYGLGTFGWMGLSPGPAYTVAQDVCFQVLHVLPEFDGTSNDFLRLVFGEAAGAVRSAGKEIRDAPTPSADPREEPEKIAVAFGQVLAQLPEQLREVIVLRVIVGLSSSEAAAVLGVTPGAVRVAQHRALTKMRKIMANFA